MYLLRVSATLHGMITDLKSKEKIVYINITSHKTYLFFKTVGCFSQLWYGARLFSITRKAFNFSLYLKGFINWWLFQVKTLYTSTCAKFAWMNEFLFIIFSLVAHWYIWCSNKTQYLPWYRFNSFWQNWNEQRNTFRIT